jgi:hypothetical protein
MISWRWYCSLLKPPGEEARQRWLKTKARGKRSFVLRTGVLLWGGFIFLAMTAEYLIRKPQIPRRTIDYVVEAAINLLIWPVAGYFFGSHMWGFYETYFDERNRQSPLDLTGSK